jgi:uroporphyrinogen III methyltransferase / synthase
MVREPADKAGLAVLVGAGPAGPELITREGAGWLARAEVVVYDRLASPELLDLAPASAERIDVGKQPDRHKVTQSEINALLVERVLGGKLVVRLKGGDPLIFGRGGEEADALAEAGLDFRIVPGVTAASAAAAWAGISLTDRRVAASVAFVTGHEDPAKAESSIDYAALAGIDTVVVYMSVGRIEAMASALIAAGRNPAMPAAVVRNAGLPDQQVVRADLSDIAEATRRADLAPPALLIVGEVVRMNDRLNWSARLPLAGRTVLVTRTPSQFSELAQQLREAGALVVRCPTIDIAPPADFRDIDAALARLADFDWLVLTSPNGVDALLDRARQVGLDGRALAGVRLAVVGPGTAEALQRRFLHADLLPETHTTAALGQALLSAGVEGKRLLLARSDLAPDDLPESLGQAGAEVVPLTAYRTVRPDLLPKTALDVLESKRVDWITFTSSSTVEHFLDLLDRHAPDARELLAGVRLASIGPITSAALRSAGLEPAVEADPHTIPGLVVAIRQPA